jgi:hypothetical protein
LPAWIDNGAPGSSTDFTAFVARLTNGTSDWLWKPWTFNSGEGGGGVGISETELLGQDAIFPPEPCREANERRPRC